MRVFADHHPTVAHSSRSNVVRIFYDEDRGDASNLLDGLGPDRLTWALEFARLGYKVHPLAPGAKKPLEGSRGCHDATTDPDTITAWWTEWPTANIGIAPDHRWFAADLDEKDAKTGVANFTAETGEREHPCPLHTASGGQHWLYRLPDGHAISNGAGRGHKDSGIDVRASGGYIVAPGSTVDGKLYKGSLPAVDDLPLAPAKVLELVGRKRDHEKIDTPLGDLDTPRQVERFVDWLRTHAPECVEGRRNDTVARKLAPTARDMGVSADRALPLIAEHWPGCDLDPAELETAVRSGWRSAQNAPGSRDAVNVFADHLQPANDDGVQKKFAPYYHGVSPRPAPKPRLHKYLPRQELWLHSAPPKTMKTHFFMLLAAAASEGREFAGHAFQKEGAAVYCLGEGTDSIPSRQDNIAEQLGLDALPRLATFDRVPLVMRPETLSEWDDVFVEVADQHGAINLIVLDTARRVLAGGNVSNEEHVGMLIDYGEKLARDFDCLVLVIHHPGKAKDNDVRGSAILETDPGVVTTHDVDSAGKLWLKFKFHRYVDPSDIPALCWDVRKGADGPQFEFAPDAKRMKSKAAFQAEVLTHRVQKALEDFRKMHPEDPENHPERFVRVAHIIDRLARENLAHPENPETSQSTGFREKKLKTECERLRKAMDQIRQNSAGLLEWEQRERQAWYVALKIDPENPENP